MQLIEFGYLLNRLPACLDPKNLSIIFLPNSFLWLRAKVAFDRRQDISDQSWLVRNLFHSSLAPSGENANFAVDL